MYLLFKDALIRVLTYDAHVHDMERVVATSHFVTNGPSLSRSPIKIVRVITNKNDDDEVLSYQGFFFIKVNVLVVVKSLKLRNNK